MERAEAEAILDGDRETAVGLLLRLDELVEANQRLVDANERLEARVAELERRLNRSSRNSSLPPSQDPPSAPPCRRGRAFPASGRRAAADRGQGERASAAPGVLPGVRGCDRGRAARRVAVGVRAAAPGGGRHARGA